jgi:hypothetical protein
MDTDRWWNEILTYNGDRIWKFTFFRIRSRVSYVSQLWAKPPLFRICTCGHHFRKNILIIFKNTHFRTQYRITSINISIRQCNNKVGCIALSPKVGQYSNAHRNPVNTYQTWCWKESWLQNFNNHTCTRGKINYTQPDFLIRWNIYFSIIRFLRHNIMPPPW